MVFCDFQAGIGWHFVLEGVLILAVIAEEDILVDIEHSVLDVLLSEGSEELSVQVVRDSSSVEHLADHVLEHSCVDLLDLTLLRCGADEVVEVLLDEAERSLEVGVVELVGHTPTEGTEFSTLNDDGVQVAHSEDKVFPVCVVHLLQEFLVDHGGEGLV